jgi:hypothetical protein
MFGVVGERFSPLTGCTIGVQVVTNAISTALARKPGASCLTLSSRTPLACTTAASLHHSAADCCLPKKYD